MKPITWILGTIVLALSALATTYIYLDSRPIALPSGSTVAGVQIGELDKQEAYDLLQEDWSDLYEAKRVVRVGKAEYPLSGEKVAFKTDRFQLLDEAWGKAERQSVWQRYIQPVPGEDRRETRVVDQEKIRSFVSRVADSVGEGARDADLKITPAGLSMIKAKSGSGLKKPSLESIESLFDRREGGVVKAAKREIEPEIRSRSDLAKKYPAILVVNRKTFRLHLYKGMDKVKTYKVAVGAAGYATPSGLYNIQNKAVNPTWNVPDSDWAGSLAGTRVPPGPDNPLKARWMGIANGVGVHGTAERDSVGSRASHGCIRMKVEDVTELYEKVPVGTPVLIR